jgi:Skp family chaperone for outer membrane proteins
MRQIEGLEEKEMIEQKVMIDGKELTVRASGLIPKLYRARFGRDMVVDMMKLVRNHPSYETNRTLLSSTEKDYKKKLDALKGEAEEVQEEGKQLAEQLRNPMLAAKAKSDIEKKIVDVQNRFIAAQQKLRAEAMRSQQDLGDLESRLLKAQTADIRKRVKEFAEAKGYDMVLDSQAAVFGKKSFDVTDEILKAMGVDPAKAKNVNESK